MLCSIHSLSPASGIFSQGLSNLELLLDRGLPLAALSTIQKISKENSR